MAEAARKQELAVQLTVAELRRLVREEVAAAVANHDEAKAKEVLGFKEVCVLVDASGPTVRRWIQQDDFPHARLGGRGGGTIMKFRRSEVLAWLNARGQ